MIEKHINGIEIINSRIIFKKHVQKAKKFNDVNTYLCKPLLEDELNRISDEINVKTMDNSIM